MSELDGEAAGADDDAIDIAGEVRAITTEGWPEGYTYGATRYADVILKEAFPGRFRDLQAALGNFWPTLQELRTGGGGRTVFVKRFDDSLADMLQDDQKVWGKQNITIFKQVGLDGKALRTRKTRGHEIDMFGMGTLEAPLPGVGVEMEWNNKDPFYDRDLINFQALHQEGAIAVGVIVTRGPALQELIGPTIRSKDGGLKFGQSTTHWNKLIPKVNLGGGGECPLLLVGIEPGRIKGVQLAQQVKAKLDAIDERDRADREARAWDSAGQTYREWQAEMRAKRDEVRDMMPPLKEAPDVS